MKRILATTDGSEGANRAVDYAADLAKQSGAPLLIANAIGGYGLPDEIFREFTRSQATWLDELLRSNSAGILTKARDRAQERGAAAVEIESLTGEVGETIARIAEDKDVEAIVVGKRGASGVAALVLGGVAHKLVSLSSRPVIVVP